MSAMKNDNRLFSLDILRGLDMLLLTVVSPIFWAANKIWPMPEAVTSQFKHPWGGFTLWDIIMPLFIFMCGAAIPYALAKRLDANGRPTRAFWRHVFGRVVLLWFCGMLVQGNLATLDILKISPYNNTLETIAAGYLIAALVMLIPVRAVRIAIPFLLAGIYGLLLHFLGDYSKTGNFAAIVEAKCLAAILPADNMFMKSIANPQVGVPYGGYTWFLTTLMFGFMTLCGAQCAEILRGVWDKRKKASALFAVGAGLLTLGWGFVLCGVPMNKHLYTISFTFQAMGWCTLALSILYVLTDILMLRRGWWLVTLYGQCALTAYMASHFFRPALDGATKAITQGFPQVINPTYMPLATALVYVALLTFVCWVRRRLRGVKAPIVQTPPTTVPPPTESKQSKETPSAQFKPIQLKKPTGPAPAPADVPERG